MGKMKTLEALSVLNPLKTRTRTAVTAGVVTLPLGISMGKKEEKYKQQQQILMGKTRG